MTLNMMLDNAVPEAIAGALTQQHPGLFFTMVEQASVAISLTDARANIIYANPAFCRQSGYSLAQLLNQNPRLLASSQTPREIYQQMWQTLLQRQPWRGQLINQRRDGGLYLVDIDITPVLNPQGELEHYLAMQRDISVSYTLEQRLRNHMTLMEAVLNNIPAAVVVVDEQDRVVMDNLAYKTYCADCGGKELLVELQVSPRKMGPGAEQILPVVVRGAVRWLSVTCWALPGVSEEASRYFVDSAPARTLVVIADCTQQRQQQEQGRLDRLKQQMTAGKLLAAIRESLDAALIQLNCPINMLAAARRLNGEGSGNVALDAGDTESAARARASVLLMLGVFGLDPDAPEWADAAAAGDDLKPVVDGLVGALLEQRAQARARKDWPAADAVRDTLKNLGLKVEDTPAGPRWSMEN